MDGNICKIKLSNPLECALRIWIQHEEETISKYFYDINPITLSKGIDTTISIHIEEPVSIAQMNFPSRYGDPTTAINPQQVSLPFKANSTYKIIQGNNGKFSHQDDYSKYALDFSLENGDTICAVADGYVIGMIEGYSKSGTEKAWRGYANLLTLYHPELNLFSQYVHLEKNGSLVSLGDKVKEHQAIGICGMTGFTNIEHLHFALLKAVDNSDGLHSIPVVFKEGYEGITLKKHDMVTNKK